MTNTQATDAGQGVDVALLPCPFCGGEAEIAEQIADKWRMQATYSVQCYNRDCQAVSDYYLDKADAVAWWNRRTDATTIATLTAQLRSADAAYDELMKLYADAEAQVAALQQELAQVRDTSRIADATLTGDLEIARDEIACLRGELAAGRYVPVPDGEYDMDDGNVYKLYAGRKLLRYENGYYCGAMQLPAEWSLIRTKEASHDEKL